MKKRVILGELLMILGLFIILNATLLGITGFAIGGFESPRVSTFFGLVFIIVGMAVFLANKEGKLEKTLAQQVLENRKVDPKVRFIKKVARKSGYVLEPNVKEGTPVYDQRGEYITVIPKGNKVRTGTYWSIIKALASGESSFRKRYKTA